MLLTLYFLPVAGIGIELKLGEHGDRQQHHPRLWQISKVLSIISPLGRKKTQKFLFLWAPILFPIYTRVSPWERWNHPT